MRQHDTAGVCPPDSPSSVLCGLLSYHLFGVPFTPPPGVDWNRVYRESCLQAVQLTAFQNAEKWGMDPALRLRIASDLSRVMLRDTRVHAGHSFLDDRMTENHIPYCVLKGAASAYFYPNPLLRAMGDVDFYVPEAYFDAAQAVMIQAGFHETESHGSDGHHICYEKEGQCPFELHREVAGIPDGEAGRRIQAEFRNLCETALPVRHELAHFRCPDAFHHGLILLTHMQHHLLAEGFGLRHLSDYAVFVAQFGEGEFEAIFHDRLLKVGLWPFACSCALTASLYIGLPYQAWMGHTPAERKLSEDLFRDILSGGNFGVKDQARIYEGLVISERGKAHVRSNRLKEGVASLNRIVRSEWKAARKCPLILPFGWIWFYARHVFLDIRKKRQHVGIFRAYRGGGRRRKLYRRLHLFETDDGK